MLSGLKRIQFEEFNYKNSRDNTSLHIDHTEEGQSMANKS